MFARDFKLSNCSCKVNFTLQPLQRSERSQRSYGNHSTAIATIVTITAIVCVLRSEQSQRLYGNQTSPIVTIAAIECFKRSQLSQRSKRSSTITWKLGFTEIYKFSFLNCKNAHSVIKIPLIRIKMFLLWDLN